MRDGERLVRWLTFQDVDRAPFHQIFGAWPLTVERWEQECGFRNLNFEAYFDLDLGFETVPVSLGLYPPFERHIVKETGEYYVVRDERGILMRQRHDLGSVPEFLQHPVKGWDDWEVLKAERLNPASPGRYQVDWECFNRYLGRTGKAARLGYYPYGLFGTARDLMGVTGLLYGFYDQPDLVKDIMDTLTKVWVRIYERAVEHVSVACIHLWEDMAGRQGSLISPKMIEQFMVPNYRLIGEFAASHSVPLFSVDSDGDVAKIVPAMVEAGVNLFWPFEVQAGCDIEEYRERYPRLGIMGGLDKRALARGKGDIDLELERAARMVRKRGYVASLDHEVPPDVPWDSYCYYMRTLRQMILDF
jgi:uroporphyrinogen decarboxylase